MASRSSCGASAISAQAWRFSDAISSGSEGGPSSPGLAMAIGVAELTHAVKEVENQSFRTFETFFIATIIYLCCSLLLMSLGAWLSQRSRPVGAS